MPQEFHIVRCYTCETFQVHIVKKSNKWNCKMCGEKQSLKKVYFKGTAKDCRLNVQALNEKRILNNTKNNIQNTSEIDNYSESEEKNEDVENYEPSKASKWKEFLTSKDETPEDEEIEDPRFTFIKPVKRKSYTTNQSIKNKKIKSSDESFNHDQYNHETIKQNSFMEENSEKHDVQYIQKSKLVNYNVNNENMLDINISEPDERKKQKFHEFIKNKESKWNCFIDTNSSETNEIEGISAIKNNETVSCTNIFTSNVSNLDAILDI